MSTRLARPSAGLLAVVLLISFATTAQASKARLKALSQSDSGSLFVKDARNIFLNPAMVNELENNANFEWGSSSGLYAAAGQLDTKPNAEGGGLLRTSFLNYAVEVGRLGSSTKTMIDATSVIYGGTALFFPQNGLDFVIGGPAGALKWGAGLHYARSQDVTSGSVDYPRKNARDLSVSGGVLAGSLSGYARLDLIAESATDGAATSQTYGGKLGGELGGKFDFDALQSVGLALGQTSFHFDLGTGTAGDVQARRIRADYYRLLLAKENTNFFVTAGLSYITADISYSNVGRPSDSATLLTSPVVLGLEHRALSWLDLRVSASQSVLLERSKSSTASTDVEKHNIEDTKVAAGFTAHAGDIKIDATFEGVSTGKLNAAALGADVAFVYNF